MKKFVKKVTCLLVALISVLTLGLLAGCEDDSKTITICASEVPHAEVLEECVKSILEEKGYKLKIEIVNWDLPNGSVESGDCDANYFQHIPYLETQNANGKLFAVCKVHYEPLGIYRGKSNGELLSATSFEICDDPSNAIRAFQLLAAKGIEIKNSSNELPYSGEDLSFNGDTWTTKNGVQIKLIPENTLVASLKDYDFACLPCNTAYTGNITSTTRVAVEDDSSQVSLKANILVARVDDYNNDAEYKAKIDALADALLSEEVSQYFATKYLGAMTCDNSTQIDLR